MPTFLVRSRLRPGAEGEYEAAHRDMPADVAEALYAAGFTGWAIFRDGRDLVHVVACDDWEGCMGRFHRSPAGSLWEDRMAGLREGGRGELATATPATWVLTPGGHG